MESSRLLYLSIILCLLQTINLGPLVAHSHSGNVNVGEQPLSKIAIHRAIYALDENSSVKAYSLDLGTKGEDSHWVMVQLESPNPSVDDWVAVFFLENLNKWPVSSKSLLLCVFLNTMCGHWTTNHDFSAVTAIRFANPNAPVYPCVSQGKAWTEGEQGILKGIIRRTRLRHPKGIKTYSFKSSPYPGQDTLQRVVIFGDMGKDPFMMATIQVANVVCQLRPCSMFLLRTEQNFACTFGKANGKGKLPEALAEHQCVSSETTHYAGTFSGTMHIVVGGGGSHISNFGPLNPSRSLYQEADYGFVKLTAFNHSSLLYEYK
ncbi:hypothetical protein WN944_013425 [Citrus x changshan-huyou]|uniref:Purple acid phosphatase C-terminal domain-containing protein n=1 Tax=Citrus x changshan-huyou TaxID=2935761 RepID=A0AAP0M3U8_9ROSI